MTTKTEQDKARAMMMALCNMVITTVEEFHPEPVPETSVYLAFQTKNIPIAVFNRIVELSIKTGLIKKGPRPHTLIKGG